MERVSLVPAVHRRAASAITIRPGWKARVRESLLTAGSRTQPCAGVPSRMTQTLFPCSATISRVRRSVLGFVALVALALTACDSGASIATHLSQPPSKFCDRYAVTGATVVAFVPKAGVTHDQLAQLAGDPPRFSWFEQFPTKSQPERGFTAQLLSGESKSVATRLAKKFKDSGLGDRVHICPPRHERALATQRLTQGCGNVPRDRAACSVAKRATASSGDSAAPALRSWSQ
jgi:hypothetical protein